MEFLAPFSENEEVSDDEEENLTHLRNYTAEVAEFLVFHDTVSVENALLINKFMQNMLIHLKNKLVDMLQNCREKYNKNEKLLTSGILKYKTNKNRSYIRNYTFCGAPFFKDEKRFAAPSNEDYLYRSNVLKELFPIDMKERSIAVWTLKDKLGLIQGIKSQIIDYLDGRNSKSLKKAGRNSEKVQSLEKNIAVYTGRLVDLLSKADDGFKINWFRVSMEQLGGRHPDHCCEAMWNLYLRPELNHGEWTEADNKKLFKISQNNRFQDWEKIAQEMGNRSSYQCIVHFQTVLTPSLRDKKKRWTKMEDMLLQEAVDANRVGDVIKWNKVLSHFPHKTKTQLYVRFKYALDPTITKRGFTKEEDCTILAAVQQFGENFKNIPKSLFPGRSKIQVKGRYFNVLKNSRSHRSWTPEDDKKLLELAETHGTSNWVAISEILKSHSRTSCRTRYMVIQKYLKKYPHKTVEDIPRKRKKSLADVHMDNWIDKIIEIKKSGDISRPKIRQKKSETYRERRRSVERDYYEFFKYSYNFKYGEVRGPKTGSVKGLLYLKHLLHIQIDLDVLELNKDKFSHKERDLIKQLLNNKHTASICEKNTPADFKLPPSWNTILGLRAICIQLTSETLCESSNITPVIESDINEEVIASHKELFKQRFLTVFYKTALLAKLSPSIRGELMGDMYTIEPVPKRRKQV